MKEATASCLGPEEEAAEVEALEREVHFGVDLLAARLGVAEPLEMDPEDGGEVPLVELLVRLGKG